MLRLFAALPIPDAVADEIVPMQRKLDGAKWSPRENLHLTLRFMGGMDERRAEDVDAALAEVRSAPFEIELEGVGFFGGDEPHALWLGVRTNAALLDLQKQCERACRRGGLVPEARKYTPHVTLCYLPRSYPIYNVITYQQDHNITKTSPWLADRFYLYASRTQSSGPSRYSIEAEYPLLA